MRNRPTPETDASWTSFCAGNKAFSLGDYNAALAHFESSRRIRITPENTMYMGLCVERLGDPKRALGLFKDALGLAKMLRKSPEAGAQIQSIIAEIEAAIVRVTAAR